MRLRTPTSPPLDEALPNPIPARQRPMTGSFALGLALAFPMGFVVAELSSRDDGAAQRIAENDWAMMKMEARLIDLEAQSEVVGSQVDAVTSRESRTRRELQNLRNDVLQQSAAWDAALVQESPSESRAKLRKNILEPVFQLSGDDAVGSAVLFAQGEDEEGGHYFAFTSYHVVRDILAERTGGDDEPVVDGFLERDGTEIPLRAQMIAHDVPTDLALLKIQTERDLGPIAQLAPLSRLNEIETFSSVYTVGCPLGTAAQATHGEITRTEWIVGGEDLWMISSPAYFGNSGGGVFLEDTHELVGIFAKIYTHGSYRPQVVTHMGLSVPLHVIYRWMEEIGYGGLLPEEGGGLAMVEEATSTRD